VWSKDDEKSKEILKNKNSEFPPLHRSVDVEKFSVSLALLSVVFKSLGDKLSVSLPVIL
jgi:hypothetical protein